MLSALPRKRVEEILNRHGMPRFTENTITSRWELFDRVDTVQERGWAVDKGERLKELRCVSVPVAAPDGSTLGAVSISGPKSRLDKDRLHVELADQLLRAQNIIEINVTYR